MATNTEILSPQLIPIEAAIDWMDDVELSMALAAIILTVALTVLLFHRRSSRLLQTRCWYCNQSITLLRGRDDPRDWQCPHCEARNLFDEDGKTPMDIYAPGGEDDQSSVSGKRFTRSIGTTAATGSRLSITANRLLIGDGIKRQLCDHCQDLQTRKIEMLRSFDAPELSDETFALAADEYAAQLELRFPLCDNCAVLVAQAVADSKRFVLRNSLNNILEQSKRAIKTGKIAGRAWPLRVFRWHLMTWMRRLWHLMVWYTYIQYAYDGSVLIAQSLRIPSRLILWGNLILIWPSLYFPVRIPALPTEERKLKANLRGKETYLIWRLLLATIRIGVSVMIIRDKNVLELTHSMWLLFILDIGIITLTRLNLRLADGNNRQMLRKIGSQLVTGENAGNYQSTITTQVDEVEEWRRSNLSSSTTAAAAAASDQRQPQLNAGSIAAESEARRHHRPDSPLIDSAYHPFHVNNLNKRYCVGNYNANTAASSSSRQQGRLQSQPSPLLAFGMSREKAESITQQGFSPFLPPSISSKRSSRPIFNPSNDSSICRQTPSWGRLNLSSSNGATPRASGKVEFEPPRFMPPQEATGIESLIAGVKLDDPVDRFTSRLVSTVINGVGNKERSFSLQCSLFFCIISLLCSLIAYGLLQLWGRLGQQQYMKGTE